MKKIIFVFLVFCLIALSGCTMESIGKSVVSKMTNVLKEHTVFKTVLEIKTSHKDNVSLLEKRFDILGIEIVEKAEDKYTVLSHFPITQETVDSLQSNKVACILDKNGEIILSADDFSDIECSAVNLNLTLVPSVTALDIWGAYTFAIDDDKYEVWVSTEIIDEDIVISCIWDEIDIAVLHDFAIAISRGDTELKANIFFVEESKRVTDKMNK